MRGGSTSTKHAPGRGNKGCSWCLGVGKGSYIQAQHRHWEGEMKAVEVGSVKCLTRTKQTVRRGNKGYWSGLAVIRSPTLDQQVQNRHWELEMKAVEGAWGLVRGLRRTKQALRRENKGYSSGLGLVRCPTSTKQALVRGNNGYWSGLGIGKVSYKSQTGTGKGK